MSDPVELTLTIPASALVRLAEALAAALEPQGPAPAGGWLSGAQAAADYLDWPKARVHQWIGRLPHYRAGGRLMFKREELDDWVATQREGPNPPLDDPRRATTLLRDHGIRPLRP